MTRSLFGRRQHLRTDATCRVLIQRADATVLHSDTLDVSSGGALLGDEAAPLRLREDVDLTFYAAGTVVTTFGRVVRLDGDRRAVAWDALDLADVRVLRRAVDLGRASCA